MSKQVFDRREKTVSSIVNFHLRQDTPMWHFQCRNSGIQKGAILRGSDVKPRLDRFIINQMKKNRISWEKYRISRDHDALNYKIQIRALGEPTSHNMGDKAFFANMGKNIDKELSVFYPGGIDVKIVCFIPELLKQIKEHIGGFFLINNFGTRQDKGFGSFTVDKVENENYTINPDKVLALYAVSEEYNAYRISTSGCSDDKTLDNAYVLYQLMKSGINYGKTYKKALLTEYMLSKGIGGEKRWMKKEKIAPNVRRGNGREIISDERIPSDDVKDYRYIRAILGVSGNQSWFTSIQDGYDRNNNPRYKKYGISVGSKKIDRFQSPITITVTGDTLYFIAYNLNTDLFDKEFEFSNNSTEKRGSIKTPSEFDMEEFMDYCSSKVLNDRFSVGVNNYQFELTKLTLEVTEK